MQSTSRESPKHAPNSLADAQLPSERWLTISPLLTQGSRSTEASSEPELLFDDPELLPVDPELLPVDPEPLPPEPLPDPLLPASRPSLGPILPPHAQARSTAKAAADTARQPSAVLPEAK
jgi:hypothetical protein